MHRILTNKQVYQGTISCEEQGKKVIFNCNKTKFYKIKIDCSMFNNITDADTPRCDYAISSIDLSNIVLYIELKGSDIKKAFKQIESTHCVLGKNFNNSYIAIAYTGNPFAKTIIQKYKMKFRNQFKEIFSSSKQLNLLYDLQNNCIKKS